MCQSIKTISQSYEQHKTAEWCLQMLRHGLRRDNKIYRESSAIDLQMSCDLQIRSRTVPYMESFMRRVSMAEQMHQSHKSTNELGSVGCNRVTGLQRTENMFSGETNHAFLFGSSINW